MDTPRSSPPLFLMIVLFVIGPICLALGGWFGWSSWRVTSGGKQVPGTVVAMIESKGKPASPPAGKRPSVSVNQNNSTWAPEVEYTVDGKTYRIRGHTGSSTPAYGV